MAEAWLARAEDGAGAGALREVDTAERLVAVEMEADAYRMRLVDPAWASGGGNAVRKGPSWGAGEDSPSCEAGRTSEDIPLGEEARRLDGRVCCPL